MHFVDLLWVRQLIADATGGSVTDMSMANKEGVRTIDDVNAICFTTNRAWFAFMVQNRNTYFNSDFNSGHASIVSNGLKVKTFQDMAIFTTSVKPEDSSSFDGKFNTSTGMGDSSQTAKANFSTNYHPIYVFPRGAFELSKPSAQNYTLSLKDMPNKRWEKAFYGECNLFGKRIYDQLVYRLWIDVTNGTVIS